MRAHWKWNHASQASHWIISSSESGLPQRQYTGMRMFVSILWLSFLSVEKVRGLFISKQCRRWLHNFVRSNETIMLFPAAMWSAVAITNRPQSHSPCCCWTGTDDMRRLLLAHGIGGPSTHSSCWSTDVVRGSEEKRSYKLTSFSWKLDRIQWCRSLTKSICKAKEVKLVHNYPWMWTVATLTQTVTFRA